ncbi:2OG-Fe(II) oxygenase family protein [Allosphingosinicella humi]
MTDNPRLDALRRLEGADLGDADGLFHAGLTAMRNGLDREVLPFFEAGLKHHPGDARLWQVLGLAHRKLEETAEAMRAFGKAASLSPGDALLAHSVARTTLEAGLPATSAFERARRLAPNDARVLLGQAAALFAEGRLADAIAVLDEQLNRNPGWLEGHATVTRLRWMFGEKEESTASFRAALRKAPRALEIWHALLNTLIDAELYDVALATIAEARGIAGQSPIFDTLEGICFAEQGDFDGAERLFGRLGPHPHITLVVRHVRHLLRSGKPEEAARLAEARVSDEGGDALWPYLALAWRLTQDPRWQWLEGDARFIGVYDIGDKVGSLDALAECLRGLHLSTYQPLEQSLRGGTQTDGPLFARIEPEIRRLRSAIVETVERHVAELPPYDPEHPLLIRKRGPVRFAGSWSVRLTGEGFHVNHVHPAGWISSAFYVALPETSMGGATHAGWLSLGEATELGLELPPVRMVEPKPGRLVLFPSTMWHGTRSFAAGERLTVAFDVARPLQ